MVQALVAEGIGGVMEGYVNVHCLPAFRRKIAFGPNGFPWVSPFYRGAVSYSEGICPVAEKLHKESFFGIELCLYTYTDDDIDLLIKAFKKVWKGIESGQLC